jgi:hypothetical protein
VPARRPAELRFTPAGRVPLSVKVAEGTPFTDTTNEPGVPAVKVVEAALEIGTLKA